MAVDGGDGDASVGVTPDESSALAQMATRTASDPSADPTTGAELGMGVMAPGAAPGTAPH
jgi:Mn-containing catalase